MNLAGAGFCFFVFLSMFFYRWLITQMHHNFGLKSWIAFNALFIFFLIFAFLAEDNGISMFWGYLAFLNMWAMKECFELEKRS